jgi:hypothetical protein
MRGKIIFRAAAVAIVLVTVALIWLRIRASQDEGPIIVGNGSIEIRATDGNWQDGGSEWINQTSGTINGGDLWVKVTSSTGTCRAQGKPVHIQYSVPGNQVTFTTSGLWWWSKTRVTPKSGITFVDNKHLRAANAGDGGHITEVRTQSLTCSLAATSENVVINICSSSQVTDCQ